MGYNLFGNDKPLMETPQLTQPIQAYDKTKSVEQNMAGQGQPSAQDITAAYRTPQAKLQLQQQAPVPAQTDDDVVRKAIDPSDPTAGMKALSQIYTSPQEEERLRKASVANRRIAALGDALRHIGNIYHTTRYSPSQQFNNPVAEEQQRYEKGKAMRDAVNQKYYSYQQAKAAQDAKAKQWEADYKLKVADAARRAGYTEAQIKNMQERLEQQKAYQQGQLELGKRRADDAKDLGERRLSQQIKHQNRMAGIAAERVSIARQNANNTQAYRTWRMNGGGGGNGGSNVAPLDTPKGRITPNGRNYSNQLLQMFDYAKSKGLVQESDVNKRLRELGFGKDQSDNVKRQMVMDLLRTNQTMGDYASERLGWSYSNGSGAPSIGWDDEEDETDNGLEIGW